MDKCPKDKVVPRHYELDAYYSDRRSTCDAPKEPRVAFLD